jgi:hypothetical protein
MIGPGHPPPEHHLQLQRRGRVGEGGLLGQHAGRGLCVQPAGTTDPGGSGRQPNAVHAEAGGAAVGGDQHRRGAGRDGGDQQLRHSPAAERPDVLPDQRGGGTVGQLRLRHGRAAEHGGRWRRAGDLRLSCQLGIGGGDYVPSERHAADENNPPVWVQQHRQPGQRQVGRERCGHGAAVGAIHEQHAQPVDGAGCARRVRRDGDCSRGSLGDGEQFPGRLPPGRVFPGSGERGQHDGARVAERRGDSKPERFFEQLAGWERVCAADRPCLSRGGRKSGAPPRTPRRSRAGRGPSCRGQRFRSAAALCRFVGWAKDR